MSDLPSGIIDEAKIRDARFRAIELGIEVEAGLRDNRPLQMLMVRLREDADRAMTDFAHANPGDTVSIMGLQARVYRFIYTLETMNAILAAGHNAEEAVRAEDSAERERHDD